MPVEDERFASAVVDQAIAIAAVPWPCPCEVGPDDRYRLEELVAAGSGSFVYRATDRLLSSQQHDATVAVKIVPRQEGRRSEALPARRVEHPSIARVLDRGQLDEAHDFTVMEFIPGGTLADLAPGWPARRAAALMAQVARGVQAAHAVGVAHLDLKPSNILLTEDQTPKVSDFGLARLDDEDEGPARGNLAFMAPEQGRREPGSLTPRADIYALGGLLYYLIRGEPPNGAEPGRIQQRHQQNAAPPPLHTDRDLDRICARALAPDPAERYDAAGHFAEDLERWLAMKPLDWTHPPAWRRLYLLARRRPAGAVAIVAGLVIVAVAFTFWQIDQHRRAEQQRLVLEQVQADLEALKANLRPKIIQFGRGLNEYSDEDFNSALVWLHMLYDIALITEDGALVPVEALAEPITHRIAELEAAGHGESLECLLASWALVTLHLRAGDNAEATQRLVRIETRWGDIIPRTDPFWIRHRAMRLIADSIAAFKAGTFEPADAEALRTVRTELRDTAPDGELDQMILRLLRMSK